MKSIPRIVAFLFPFYFAFMLSTLEAKTTFTKKYDLYLRKYSQQYFGPFFDWYVFKAQAITESGLDVDARSRSGARGIMQLLPSTWKEIQSRNPEFTSINNPRWNIAAGIYYVRSHWRAWSRIESAKNRLALTFGSYNAGRGRINQARQIARARDLDPDQWKNLVEIGPRVPRWRYRETSQYILKIKRSYLEISPHPVSILPE